MCRSYFVCCYFFAFGELFCPRVSVFVLPLLSTASREGIRSSNEHIRKLLPSLWWMCWCSRYQKQQEAKNREETRTFDEENIEDSLLLVGATAATIAVVAIHLVALCLSLSCSLAVLRAHTSKRRIVVCAWQPDPHHTNIAFVRVWVRPQIPIRIFAVRTFIAAVWMLSFSRGFLQREQIPSYTRPNSRLARCEIYIRIIDVIITWVTGSCIHLALSETLFSLGRDSTNINIWIKKSIGVLNVSSDT